jgi:small-conductance mechanosensitive channel
LKRALPSNAKRQTPNDYKDRLVKLIPTEIITAYVTLRGLINGAGEQGNRQLLTWIVFGILVILNPVYLFYVTEVKKAGQIVFSSIAFVLWVMVIGGTFTTVLGYSAEYLGSILLVIYTLFVPFVYKG